MTDDPKTLAAMKAQKLVIRDPMPDTSTHADGPVTQDTVREYVDDYEFRFDDGAGYTPVEHERAMLEDAIHGYLADHPPTTPSQASGEVERLREAVTYLESEARRFAGMYAEGSDGRNTFVIFADKIAALDAADKSAAGEMTAEEHRLEDLKQMVAYTGPIVSFDVREPYYLASCDHCGWVGSSELCGTDNFGDDSDCYCPRCQASGADCGKVAERLDPAPVPQSGAGDMVLVPREPTEAMKKAATEVDIDVLDGQHTALNWGEAEDVWEYMIAAFLDERDASLAQSGDGSGEGR